MELTKPTFLSIHCNENCEECDGEGYWSVADGEDSKDIPCQKCFPPSKKGWETTWADLMDDDE